MYQLGVIKADTKKELSSNAIKHCGLLIEDDDQNIGKYVRFKKADCYARKLIYKIVCKQKVWGYDENNNYTMIEGYRGYESDSSFGMPFVLNDDVEFVNLTEEEVKKHNNSVWRSEASQLRVKN